MSETKELTTTELVALINGLMDAGLSIRLNAYRTHTGDPFTKPWTGPFAYEINVTGESVPSVINGDGMRAILDKVQALGFDVRWERSYEDGEGGLRLQPDRLMVRPDSEAER